LLKIEIYFLRNIEKDSGNEPSLEFMLMNDMIRQLLSVVNLVAEPSVVADTGVVGLKTDVIYFRGRI